MGPFVVDASVPPAWCFADEVTPFSREVLSALEKTHAVVPGIWPFEVANVLAIAERRNRITPEGSAEFLEMLRHLPIEIERVEAVWICQHVLPLTRQHRLSSYDAAYLELAAREQMPLATLDEDLRKAARYAGVSLIEVS